MNREDLKAEIWAALDWQPSAETIEKVMRLIDAQKSEENDIVIALLKENIAEEYAEAMR